ncbi:MAG: hypothetical protein A2Z88_06245 [Omnitrophica WOR_2 bacterium GWA2_47_8]|nr:MAG: hypothetical protein A2Z88_06245 [Omnitrophica WOR_2 bacterium GWA2_47_8]
MKTLKIILIIVVVLFVIFSAALFIFVKTFDANRFKRPIMDAVRVSTGRDAQIGNIALDFSVLSGVKLVIDRVSMSDDPAFSKENFLEVQKVQLDVDVNAFLTQRKVSVGSIELISPKVVIIRNPDNKLNIQQFKPLPVPESKQERGAAEAAAIPDPAPTAVQPATLPANLEQNLALLLVKRLKIQGGQVIFVDKARDPSAQVQVQNIDLSVDDLSLIEPFKFQLQAAAAGPTQNIHVNGTARVDMKDLQARLDDVKVDVDLNESLFNAVQPYVRDISLNDLVPSLSGNLNIVITQAVVGQQGLSVLNSHGALSGGKIVLKDLSSPLDNIKAEFEASESDVKLNSFSFNLGSGEVKGEGKIFDYLKTQNFQFLSTISGLKVGEMIAPPKIPVTLEGGISGQAKLTGQGFDPYMLKTLTGEIQLDLKGGKIVDINVLKFILDKISMIPDMAERLDRSLPEKYKDLLNQKGTLFKDLNLKAGIIDGKIMIPQTALASDGFYIAFQGEMDLENNASLSAAFSIEPDLSASMVEAVPELGLLSDEDKEIFIPLTPYQGKINKLILYPDLSYLGKRIMVNKGKEQLQKVLEKVFDREGGSSPEGQEGQGSGSQSPEGAIVDEILNSIFR